MITTITLNAAIDKTYMATPFALNQVNRVQHVAAEAGGKGINVAKVLQRLGMPVQASGIVGGFNGQFICQQLDRLGIAHQFVRVDEESRICLNIIDEKGLAQTELLEPGLTIEAGSWPLIAEQLIASARHSSYVVLSGSLPRGLPQESYAMLIARLQQEGVRVALDSSGTAFAAALAAKPFMVKPNREELAAYLHKATIEETDVFAAIESWSAAGISLIAVTLGAQGALIRYDGTMIRVTPPAIKPLNPVGSGDSFVAGLIGGLHRGDSLEQAARLATAAAAANALEQRAGCIDPAVVERLLAQVQIEQL